MVSFQLRHIKEKHIPLMTRFLTPQFMYTLPERHMRGMYTQTVEKAFEIILKGKVSLWRI